MPRPRPNCRDPKEQSHELPRTETERRRYPAGFASAHLTLGIGIVLTSSERSQFISHGRLSLFRLPSRDMGSYLSPIPNPLLPCVTAASTVIPQHNLKPFPTSSRRLNPATRLPQAEHGAHKEFSGCSPSPVLPAPPAVQPQSGCGRTTWTT